MTVQAVLLPLFTQVLLTFVMLGRMGHARVTSVLTGETRAKDIALGQPNWPERVTKLGNSYNNQFQLPVLFYVLVILAWQLHKADLLFVILSWAFVATRFCHAYIHVTSNHVTRRFQAFTAGLIVLVTMWIIFAMEILIAPP